jgi:hypothetical protein
VDLGSEACCGVREQDDGHPRNEQTGHWDGLGCPLRCRVDRPVQPMYGLRHVGRTDARPSRRREREPRTESSMGTCPLEPAGAPPTSHTTVGESPRHTKKREGVLRYRTLAYCSLLHMTYDAAIE